MSNIFHRKDREEGFGTNAKAIRFNQQDFKTLKKQALWSGTLFCDPTFPAEAESLGAKLGLQKDVKWKRPTEICRNPQFNVGGAAKRIDICQGDLGDCWLLAAIASLTLDKDILARVVPKDQSFQDNYAGIFHFQFWRFGEWVDVVVDDRLPVVVDDRLPVDKRDKLLFVHSAEGDFWSALLEKAYAKASGCYESLNSGNTMEGFEDFTGGIAEKFDLSKDPQFLYKIMKKALGHGSLLGCSIYGKGKTTMNLVKHHAYSVTAAKEVHLHGRPVQLVRIRNPWGKEEWSGAWSSKSSEWNYVRPEEKAKLVDTADNGEFWMAYSDFTHQFSRLEICNLTPDALTSDEVGRWNHYQFEGTWEVGSTAGGCKNNTATFCSNPQFFIHLKEVDDDPHDEEDGCSFLVGLMQKDMRREKMSGRDFNTIGYAIYQVPDKYKGRSNIHLGPDVLLQQRPVAETRIFKKRRERSCRYKLPPGEYVIVPSTREPHRKGSFVLRVFSEKQAATSQMEEDINAEVDEPEISTTDVDPHFKQLFLKIAGNDSEISAFELQQILNKVISQRTDVKTDGFSLETCHHIISLLDKDGTTKLGLVEFHTLWMKTQKYLEIFQSHDSDKSGTISSHELRGALTEAGFQLNSDVLQVIVQHYANSLFAIDFDCFMGCLVRLEMLFNMFKTLDKSSSGKIELDLFQWICLSMH